jgi:glycosyltransferase involved in cell wall biosynthesis
MGQGTPVVTSDDSALVEVAGGAGLAVPADDAAGWADALAGLLGDPAAADRLGEEGRRRASELTWGRTAERTVAAYREVL